MAKKLRDALISAANWLAENPDRHIQGNLAVDENGASVECNSTRATCFCALGRVAKELDVAGYDELDPGMFEPLNISASDVYMVNDDYRGTRDMACLTEYPGNPEVINLLKKLAEKADG